VNAPCERTGNSAPAITSTRKAGVLGLGLHPRIQQRLYLFL
jgi:hypothetical protein